MKFKSSVPLMLGLAMAAAAHPVSAQTSDIEELKAMVRSMQKTIADQNARIAALEKQQAAPAAKSTKSSAKTSPSGRSVTVAGMDIPTGELPARAIPQERSLIRNADTFQDLQQAAPRLNNAPLDPQMKGFILIPGTDTIFKIGGSARVDTIGDLSNNGNPNLFVPSSIPVPGQSGWDGGEQSTMHTKGTRLSLELRRPVPFDGTLRIYSEFDFFNDSSSSSMSFRVRHFYGQAWNFLIGQTFSAFMDPDAFPDVVDYQGPNGAVNRRQPQIRFTLPLYKGATEFELFASIEQPDTQIDTSSDQFPSGATSLTHVPDGIAGFRWEGTLGHIQGAGVFRELSFETDNGPSEDTLGWGVSLSAALDLFEKDKLSVQATYGVGVARYISDLNGLNLDATLDDSRLESLPIFAGMAGYSHQWSDHWRSTISGGYVHVDAASTMDGYTIDNTIYASANLMWQPTPSFRLGLEYLYGRKETINGAERDAHRLDFVVRYDLVR